MAKTQKHKVDCNICLKITIRLPTYAAAPASPAKLSPTFKWRVKWGQAAAERGGVNEQPHPQKYPTADDTVLADHGGSHRMILDPGASTEQVGVAQMGKGSWTFWNTVSLFYTLRVQFLYLCVKRFDSFVLRLQLKASLRALIWSEATLHAPWLIDWLTDWLIPSPPFVATFLV